MNWIIPACLGITNNGLDENFKHSYKTKRRQVVDLIKAIVNKLDQFTFNQVLTAFMKGKCTDSEKDHLKEHIQAIYTGIEKHPKKKKRAVSASFKRKGFNV